MVLNNVGGHNTKETAVALLQEWTEAKMKFISRRSPAHFAPYLDMNGMFWVFCITAQAARNIF